MKYFCDILKPKQWHNEPAVLLGGGPSLARVDRQAIYSLGHTLGCNVEYRYNPEIVFVHDDNTLKAFRSRPDWSACTSIKIAHEHCWGHVQRDYDPFPDCYKAHVNRSSRGREVWPPDFYWGLWPANNSGAHILTIASVLGCRPIYLFGYDCGFVEGRSHWHDDYRIEPGDRRWPSFIRIFDQMRSFLHEDVYVVGEHSAMPGSYARISLEDLLESR